MENIIIIAIIAVLAVVGIRSTVKHFRGESSCCGGGSSVKVKKKKLKQIVARKTVVIEGMTCEHCKNRVERVLSEMDGVAAKVNLKQKTATVSMEKEVGNRELCEVIRKAGYEVTEIK